MDQLKVSSNPHIRDKASTRGIMLCVIISLLPAAGFLIDGDVGQVVHVFFFRRFRDEYIPGGFLQRFCFRQGTEGSGLFLCFFQGVIYAEDTADQGGDSQQEKDLPVVLQEKEGDRLYQQPGSKDGAEPDQLGFDCPDRIQGQLQLFLRAVFTDPVLLFIAQRLDFPFAAEAPYGKRTDLQRPDRICGRTAAPDTFIRHMLNFLMTEITAETARLSLPRESLIILNGRIIPQ